MGRPPGAISPGTKLVCDVKSLAQPLKRSLSKQTIWGNDTEICALLEETAITGNEIDVSLKF